MGVMPLRPPSAPFAELRQRASTTHSEVTIAVADDDPASREDIARRLASFGHRVQCFASGTAFVESAQRHPPCCAVLDTRTASRSGLDARQRIGNRLPATTIVFVSETNDVEAGVAAMKAGAVDYLLKPVRGPALDDAVARAVARSLELRAQMATMEWAYQRYARLSPRERQILGLVLQGKRNKQIALELDSCESTVKVHRARIAQKLEAGTLVDMLILGSLVRQHREVGAGELALRAANE
jgi:two-component system, LuxR family, response regulator FixJ